MQDTETTDNNPTPAEGQAPAKRSHHLKREKISQKVIDELNDRYDKIMESASDTARQLIEFGERLTEVKNQMPPKKWLPFIEHNLKCSIRTAQRAMQAAKQKRDLLVLDPAEFMARIWGHKEKQLEEGEGDKKGKNDASVVSGKKGDGEGGEEGEEDRDDLKQHGGEGPSFFPDKGKPGVYTYKTVARALDREFFDSEAITSKEKLDFIQALLSWLIARREVFAKRAEAQEQAKAEQK